MTIYKCDRCKEVIDYGGVVTIYTGYIDHMLAEICKPCFKELKKFLENK